MAKKEPEVVNVAAGNAQVGVQVGDQNVAADNARVGIQMGGRRRSGKSGKEGK